MLKLSSSLRVLSLANSANVRQQTVRNRLPRYSRKPHKPTWLPTAKTKRFKITPHPVLPDDEALEIRRLYNNYYTSYKSVTAYLVSKYSLKNQAEFDHETHRREVEEDFLRCNQLNDDWNRQQAIVREQRVSRELDTEIEEAMKVMEEHEMAECERIEKAEQIVLAEIENSKEFIDKNNLDAAIERVFENPADHNYALHLDGSQTLGRETDPPPRAPMRRRGRAT